MMRNTLMVLIIVVMAGIAAAWMLASRDSAIDHGNESHSGHGSPGDVVADEHGTHMDEPPRGAHGGRLLKAGDFALELALFESGIPPEFHVYIYAADKPVPPQNVTLSIELERLGGEIDTFSFTPQGDYLRGSGPVTEPHSFDVKVSAEYDGKHHEWTYENHEGRTQIPEVIARDAGVETEIAGPAEIVETLELTGRVQTDPDRLSRIRARFSGVIRSIRHGLGDVVNEGDVLATVQSNESLQNYSVEAPIGGLIVARNAQTGETTGEEPLFIIADLSEVWVELDVFGRDLGRVRSGQAVEVETLDGYVVGGVIDWVSPLASHASQSVRVRMRLANPEGRLRPGQFVRGRVMVAQHSVPLAVRQSAIQRFRDFKVVFARFGDTYEVRMLGLGRGNRDWVEVLHGLKPGTEYVTGNSYLIKADIEKSGASHDH